MGYPSFPLNNEVKLLSRIEAINCKEPGGSKMCLVQYIFRGIVNYMNFVELPALDYV